MSETTNNPLLNNLGIPHFDKIEPKHVIPAVKETLEALKAEIKDLEKNFEPTWSGLMEPLTGISMKLQMVWRPVGHLLGVKNSKELREASETVQGDVISFGLSLGQNKVFYDAMKALKNSAEWAKLEKAQQRIVNASILSGELSGIALEGAKKDRFNELSRELSEIKTKFQNNVLDSTKEFDLLITKKEEIAGLPESYLAAASQTYNSRQIEGERTSTPEAGPWLITLDGPSYVGFMSFADHRGHRHEVQKAYVTRATEGEFDNSEYVVKILQLKKEKANLLGYKNAAELSLATKMAETPDEVYNLEDELLIASKEIAEKEIEELQQLANENGFTDKIAYWDLMYWSKKLQEKKFQYNDEQLKPYLSMPRVLDGMFSLVKKIFAIDVKAADGEVPVWHEDVRFFKIFNEAGTHIASFFLDPFARPENKRGGAWMNTCVDRRIENAQVVVPVAYIVCNGTSPVGDAPSLMTFGEVTTLFHEFGHALQHMMTTVDYTEAAGINLVEWDAVELPSQFMENWCYHKETLLGMAKHYQTGETLPEEFFNKVLAAKNFMSAWQMVRQIYLGLTDMDLHVKYDPYSTNDVFQIATNAAKRALPVMPMDEDRFLCSFTHVFAGGYAAGYYSYKWAEVLSADAFAAFEEVGLENEKALQKVGYKFRDTVLGLGGGEHPSEVYRQFRGRDASTEALLRHSDLLSQSSGLAS